MSSESERLSELFEAIGLKPAGSPETTLNIAYFISLGIFTHVWAFWEHIFDLCVVVIYQRSPLGKKIDKKRPVTSLERKLRYFRKAHASIPKLKPYMDGAEKLAHCIEMMSGLRHTIIHSAHVPADTPMVREFRRMLPSDDLLLIKKQTLDHHTIIEAAKMVNGMLAPTLTYAKLLMNLFPEKDS